MKLVELKCKNCGGILKVQPGTTDIHCEHCKTNYKLDDEAQHIKYDDMGKAGYDYEKGKLKARQEHELEKQRQKIEAQQAAAKAEKDAKMKKWIILAWIFFFPFMFTYWLWAKGTLDKRIKIILTVGVWLFFIIVGTSSGSNTSNQTRRTTSSTEQMQSTEVSGEDNASNEEDLGYLRKCTVMEAADLHNTGGQKTDNLFNEAKKTCDSWLQEWGKDDFYEAIDVDWKNRSGELIDGKPLTDYIDQLGW